jgi:hypothetical protein
MKRRRFLAALLLVATTGVAAGAEKALPPATTAKGTNVQTIAYYFHGTIRCETCLRIEKQAREAIERRFPVEMAEKRLVFKPVNYEQPENAHFLKDYKLPCPSLVVVRQQGGKDEQWKLLEKTWEHIESPLKFKAYVVEETEALVLGAKSYFLHAFRSPHSLSPFCSLRLKPAASLTPIAPLLRKVVSRLPPGPIGGKTGRRL